MGSQKVSVVVITYSHEKYLEDTIKGIFEQKFDGEIELIISNDNSPDNSDAIIKELIKECPENIVIKYTRHPKNLGMLANYNWAMEQCTSDYIAFCEGDDYWINPLKLQKQVDFLEMNEDYGLCFSDVNFVTQKKQIIYRDVFKEKILPSNILTSREFVLKKFYYAPCSWLGRKDLFKLETIYDFIVDGTFAVMIEILNKTKIYFLPDTTACYRLSDESASRSKSLMKLYNREIDIYKTQLFYMEKLNFYDIQNKINESAVTSIAYLITKNYESKEFFNALRELDKTEVLQPIVRHIKKWIYIRLSDIKIPFLLRIKIFSILKINRLSRKSAISFLASKKI